MSEVLEIALDVARIRTLTIAGWTGRDPNQVERHIRELGAIGIPRPARIPEFYRVAADLLTTDAIVGAPRATSTGEVEFVLLAFHDGLHVGVGSDHTDRELERSDVTRAKQICAKPVAPVVWRYDDVAPHWDELRIRSFVEIRGARRIHQDGVVAAVLAPRDLIERYEARVGEFVAGSALFCGTLSALGPIEPADIFEIELSDPVLGRTLRHRYALRE